MIASQDPARLFRPAFKLVLQDTHIRIDAFFEYNIGQRRWTVCLIPEEASRLRVRSAVHEAVRAYVETTGDMTLRMNGTRILYVQEHRLATSPWRRLLGLLRISASPFGRK